MQLLSGRTSTSSEGPPGGCSSCSGCSSRVVKSMLDLLEKLLSGEPEYKKREDSSAFSLLDCPRCPESKDSVNPHTKRYPHGVFEASRDKRAHCLTHFWKVLDRDLGEKWRANRYQVFTHALRRETLPSFQFCACKRM